MQSIIWVLYISWNQLKHDELCPNRNLLVFHVFLYKFGCLLKANNGEISVYMLKSSFKGQ